MVIDRRQLLGLGVRVGTSAFSASLLTGLYGCSSSAGSSSRLIGGYQKPGGKFGVGAISADISNNAELAWVLPTKSRVHGLATHATQPLAAVAARRPGDFVVVFDPQSGTQAHQLNCPKSYFLEGHVEFSGQQLWATATSRQDSTGCLLGWDLSNIERLPKLIRLPGIGPHQVLQGTEHKLWVAVGGWKTQNREILNPTEFKSFLVSVDVKTGSSTSFSNPSANLSLRHIAYSNGELFAGMQYPIPKPSQSPLVFRFKQDKWQQLEAPDSGWQAFRGYIASVAMNADSVVATSPQGYHLGLWNRSNLKSKSVKSMLDVAGATNIGNRLFVSSGTGLISNPGGHNDENGKPKDYRSPLHWDNHWIGYQPSLT